MKLAARARYFAGLASALILCSAIAVFAEEEMLVSGIRSQSDQFLFDPAPQRSKYLQTFQGGFYVSKAGARYYCLWDVTKARDENLYVRMELDDPLRKQQPIIQEGVIEPTANSLSVAYGPVHGLKMYDSYRVKVFLYRDAARTDLIDQLTQKIKSYVDTRDNRLLIDKGLVTADGRTFADVIGEERAVHAGRQESMPSATDVTYEVYENQELGVHVKYPASWHVKLSETPDVRQILFSRESVDEPPGKYTVGMQIMQFVNIGRKAPWLELADPDKAADQWLNATLQATPGQNELLDTKVMTVGGKRAYYAELRMQASYPMRLTKLTMFYPTTFSELICEAPEAEFEQVRAIFEEVIHDERLAF